MLGTQTSDALTTGQLSTKGGNRVHSCKTVVCLYLPHSKDKEDFIEKGVICRVMTIQPAIVFHLPTQDSLKVSEKSCRVGSLYGSLSSVILAIGRSKRL